MPPVYFRQIHSEGVEPIGIETQIPWWQPLYHPARDADEDILPWSMVNRSSIRDMFLLFLRRQPKLTYRQGKKKPSARIKYLS